MPVGHSVFRFFKEGGEEQQLVGETPDLIKCLRTLDECWDGVKHGADRKSPLMQLDQKKRCMWMCPGNRKTLSG